MRTGDIRKHLFYGTVLILLFMGSLGSVFRDDFTGKVVTVVCSTILFSIAVVHYVWRHRLFP